MDYHRKSVCRGIAASVAILTLGGAAMAADPSAESVDHMFDVAFGATVTSDYISRGITQTDHTAAIQGYIEPSVGIFYGGVWASNVAFGGVADVEVDVYAGIRPEFDMLSFDFGYNHAFYINDPGSDSGEVFAKAYATVVEPLTIGAEAYVNPQGGATYIEANADLTLPHNFGISGAVGHVGGDMPYATWNGGIYYTIGEWGTIDLRYTDTGLSTADCTSLTGLTGNECDARVMLAVSIDTALSALGGSN